jgi:hypothetical protein
MSAVDTNAFVPFAAYFSFAIGLGRQIALRARVPPSGLPSGLDVRLPNTMGELARERPELWMSSRCPIGDKAAEE